jgi:L-ascorbate metabolism protein UlaG (beta-lactamase superfamily)
MAQLTWHGHSCFTLRADDGSVLLFDPFLDNNPAADLDAQSIDELDFILCSHGHWDHFEDAIVLARRTGATLIGTFELCGFAESKGVENVHKLNLGGGAQFPFGRAQLTPAIHSGTVAGDDEGRYTTQPSGFLLNFAGGSGMRLYFAGDTALTMEMQLLRRRVDIAMLPIGDTFTMGPEDAVRAIEMIEPEFVIPMHYDTWPPIEQDTDAFTKRVGDRARVVILEPGGSFEF